MRAYRWPGYTDRYVYCDYPNMMTDWGYTTDCRHADYLFLGDIIGTTEAYMTTLRQLYDNWYVLMSTLGRAMSQPYSQEDKGHPYDQHY